MTRYENSVSYDALCAWVFFGLLVFIAAALQMRGLRQSTSALTMRDAERWETSP